MNIKFNASGLFNIVVVILVLILVILTSACGQREHLRVAQVKQVYTKQYLHNCVVDDVVVCDSLVTGE